MKFRGIGGQKKKIPPIFNYTLMRMNSFLIMSHMAQFPENMNTALNQFTFTILKMRS